jgi:DNA (cytosine-5)-methyltransferase 1
MLKVSTFCSGIGAAEEALKNLGVEHEVVFASEIDKYARQSYEVNHDAKMMINDMCEPDYVGEQYYSDLNISGLPCQAFSLAGKRLGELDKRGVLFYDFYRWVKNQQPKVFVIENVKGLLSADKGVIFQNWCQLLGRSVNYQNHFFMHEDSLEYNLHYTVLNSKNFGVPQNRERVFIVGIRKDLPNDFRFPLGWKLDKRLRDVLEKDVDEKYYLSEKMMNYLNTRKDNFNGGKINYKNENDVASCINASSKSIDISDNIIIEKVGFINQDTQASQVYGTDGISPTLSAGTHGYAHGYIKVKEATKKGYDIAEPGDSINMSNPNSTTPRGRVGKGIANTLDTSCNQAVIEPFCVAMRGRNPVNPSDRTVGAETEQRLEANSQGITNTLTSVQKDNLIVEPQIYQTPRGFNKGGLHDICPPITSNSFENNNHIVEPELVQIAQIDGFESEGRVYDANGLARTIKDGGGGGSGSKTGWYDTGAKIRRLLPIETFRLQGYSDEFFYKCQAVNSDTRLYQQAGNTITVSVIQAIIKNLLHILK